MNLAQLIENYLKEWASTKLSLPTPARDPERRALGLYDVDFEILQSFDGPKNYVSQQGYRFLLRASEKLLAQTVEGRRVSSSTARRAIEEAHSAQFKKVAIPEKISAQAVIAGAKSRIANVKRTNGAYVFPLFFAPSSKQSVWTLGPVSLLPKERFNQIHGAKLESGPDADQFDIRFSREWEEQAKGFDHFALIDVSAHEMEMGWKAAREAAEFTLNIIRMSFGFYHTDDIRLGGDFVRQTKQAHIVLSEGDKVSISLSSGPWGSHLQESWPLQIQDSIEGFEGIFASYSHWLVSGDGAGSPIFERLAYANALLSEAYSEPHDHIRLVRLISALEALAVLPAKDKAKTLAFRCACAGGWGNTTQANLIDDAVRFAYTQRSEIVHGDAPDRVRVSQAFYGVEQHMLDIYCGFMMFFEKLQSGPRPPTSISRLRQMVESRLSYFFWDPDSD